MKIDMKAIAVGAAASLLAFAIWEVAGRDLVNRARSGASGEAAESSA
jgi:hypothetical protein